LKGGGLICLSFYFDMTLKVMHTFREENRCGDSLASESLIDKAFLIG